MFLENDYVVVVENIKSKRRHYRCYCDACGLDRGYQRINRARRPYCKSCASSITHKNRYVSLQTRDKQSRNSWIRKNPHLHPLLNKKHADETKNKIAESQSRYCKENGNQFKIGRSKGKHTEEVICKISRANSGKPPRWKGRVFQYDGPKGSFKMRSSYELAYAEWLDKNDVNWEYEPKFELSTGKIFAPDFKLTYPDRIHIVEIKGYWAPVGKEKWETFCQDYPDLSKEVLMKNDLEEIGII